MGSEQVELARHVLKMIEAGQPIPSQDALQLRHWAPTPEDRMRSLAEIARGILGWQERR